MSFISILFALLLEQARPLTRGNVVHASMRHWVRWCVKNFDAGKPWHGWLAWGLSVGGPTFGSLLVYGLLNVYVGWPVAVVWSALVLYAALGFRQFSFHFTQIRDALVDGDLAQAQDLLAQWQNIDTQSLTREDIIGKVIECSVLATHRHVFGVLTWFSVLAALGLGPAGAVLYRLCEFAPRYWHHKSIVHHQPISHALQSNARLAWAVMDWVSARLTALGFAVVGNFEDAIENWRRYTHESAEVCNDGVILAATAGAVNIHLTLDWPQSTTDGVTERDDSSRYGQTPELAHLAVVVGLVWRTAVMWILLLALLTLARLLG